MSQDAPDLARASLDAWNSGDMQTLVAVFDADTEVITDPSFPEAGPFRGRQPIRDWLEGLKESWEGDQAVLKELFEVGDNVVGRWDWTARGRGSGMETRMDMTGVYTIENRKIVRLQYYFDHATALKAVGL
jgi:ketosteroid isomerase-like protein